MGWPLRDAWRSRQEGADGATWGFLAAMLALWGLTLGVAASPEWWLQRSHHQGSFGVWALTQTVPFMYTLETDWWAERHGPAEPALAEECARIGNHGLRQHLPVGQFTNPERRPMNRLCGLPADLVLESRLRKHRVRTRWRLEEHSGVLVLEERP